MTYSAVVFDLDGTLLDTLADLGESVNAVLAAMGYPGHDLDAYRYFVGDGVVTLARRALPEGAARDEETVGRTVAEMRREYHTRWDNKTRAYDGIPQLLEELASRGVATAVWTNKPQDFAELCVSRLLPMGRFTLIQGVLPTVPPKPDPTGARRILAELGVEADEVLYLGDTDTDMQTAVTAGFFPVGVTWGFRTAEELLAHGARRLVAHPLEVLGLLE